MQIDIHGSVKQHCIPHCQGLQPAMGSAFDVVPIFAVMGVGILAAANVGWIRLAAIPNITTDNKISFFMFLLLAEGSSIPLSRSPLQVGRNLVF
jgi:hypothetical protein